jgi:hypothetical protein
MMRFLILLASFLCSSAYAAPGCYSWQSTNPAGTTKANPLAWPNCSVPVSQAYAQVGHLALLKGAKMSVTTDQLTQMFFFLMPALYQVTAVYVTNCTSTPAGSVGGIYTAPSKGGTAIVGASQTYTSLASNTSLESLTVASSANALVNSSTPSTVQFYFSLTTAASSGTPTCDIYVDGEGLQ